MAQVRTKISFDNWQKLNYKEISLKLLLYGLTVVDNVTATTNNVSNVTVQIKFSKYN